MLVEKRVQVRSQAGVIGRGIDVPRLSVTVALATLGGCAPVTETPVPPRLHDGWSVAAPMSAGFDAGELGRLTRALRSGTFPNTHAVLIEHDGSLVYEEYFGGTDERWGESLGRRAIDRNSLHDVRSVSKSVTGLLVGIALQGALDQAVQKPVADLLPELGLRDERTSILLHHVLTMTAGLDWNEMNVPYTDPRNDEGRLLESATPARYVMNRPIIAPPGRAWNYSGGLTQVLASIVYERTGVPFLDYAREMLFEPLGIEHLEWFGPELWLPRFPAAMGGLRLRARDLAKIGSLVLHNGRWAGQQIVPRRWIELSTSRIVQDIGDWSHDGLWGYGYQWWSGHLPDGRRIVGAYGNGNQRVFIVPDERIAVTILAGQYNRGGAHSERILDRVLAARL